MTKTGNPAIPTIPFNTFLRLMMYLRERGVPSNIDASALPTFPPRTAAQLVGALRWFGLLTPHNDTTLDLQLMVERFGTAAFSDILKTLLKKTYPLAPEPGEAPPSPEQIFDTVRLLSPNARKELQRRAGQFYMHAYRYAFLAPPDIEQAAPNSRNGEANGHETTVLALLIGKFPAFNPEWPNDVKVKWFAGFDRLMRSADKVSRIDTA